MMKLLSTGNVTNVYEHTVQITACKNASSYPTYHWQYRFFQLNLKHVGREFSHFLQAIFTKYQTHKATA